MWRSRTGAVALATLAAASTLLTACSLSSGNPENSSTTRHRTVVVATHDSWAMSKDVMRAFTRQTGYRVKIEPNGDVGQLTNKLVLTKGSPIADAVYGIDNSFASRAVDSGVLADYSAARQSTSSSRFDLPEKSAADKLTPIDYGDVCVNIDDVWFAKHHLAPPRTLGDLTAPRYRGLFVTPGAATSSPGLAFLLATIAKYGDGWTSYWRKLMANDAKLTAGWTDAYEVDFSGSEGHGDRPIVLSYASSPPFTIPKGQTKPTTSALLDTCFRQVEYAGVLHGAANVKGAQAFVSFMTRARFQKALPDNMYVFPVDDRVALPAAWSRFAKVAPHPFTVSPSRIAAHRDSWLQQWSDVTGR